MNAALISVALLLGPRAGANQVHFESPASGYRFDADTGGASSDAVTNQTRFLFRGHARAASKQLEFLADSIKGILITPPNSKKPILKHAETSGKATVNRTVQTEKGSDVTTITGSRFVFDGDSTLGILKISGPVGITDSGSGKSNLRMSGKSGTAEFDMRKDTAQDALRKSTLDGSVSIDIVQFGSGNGRIHATGDHLELDDTVSPASLVLTGKVAMHGEGDTGSATGIHRVKFLLNKQGQFTHMDAGEGPR
jgi:hypothetical protein